MRFNKWGSYSALLFLIVGGVLFSSTGVDDTHITFWEAYCLRSLGKLCNYNGDFVEQSSSLAHVVIIALVSWSSSLSIITVGYLLSIFFGVLSVFCVLSVKNIINPKVPDYFVLCVGACPILVYWSFSGMDTSLTAFSFLWLALSYTTFFVKPRGSFLSVISSTILFLTVRPESPFILASALLLFSFSCIVGSRQACRSALTLILVGGSLATALFLFRYNYFGTLFPQPVTAKVGGGAVRDLFLGLDYLRSSIVASATLMFIFSCWIILSIRWLYVSDSSNTDNRSDGTGKKLVGSFLFSYILFILFSGGDWMECGRFFAHILPLAMTLLFVVLYEHFKDKGVFKLLVSGLLVAQLFEAGVIAKNYSTGMPIWSAWQRLEKAKPDSLISFSWFELANKVHYRDVPVVCILNQLIDTLNDNLGRKVQVLSGQSGMIPFHMFQDNPEKVEFIDQSGLTTRDLTNCINGDNIRRNRYGLVVRVSDYFKLLDTKTGNCWLRTPDIIYNVYLSVLDPDLNVSGYEVIYNQTGQAERDSLLGGAQLPLDEYIAVRRDLLGLIPKNWGRQCQDIF